MPFGISSGRSRWGSTIRRFRCRLAGDRIFIKFDGFITFDSVSLIETSFASATVCRSDQRRKSTRRRIRNRSLCRLSIVTDSKLRSSGQRAERPDSLLTYVRAVVLQRGGQSFRRPWVAFATECPRCLRMHICAVVVEGANRPSTVLPFSIAPSAHAACERTPDSLSRRVWPHRSHRRSPL